MPEPRTGGRTAGRQPPRIRLADLLVALSGVADLGMALPIGSSVRAALVAVDLAHHLRWPERDISAVFYAALLQHIGCTAYSHEVTSLFEDEQSVKRAALATDFSRPREVVLGYLPRITSDAPPGQRLRTVRSALLHSRRMTVGYRTANCETAALVARRLSLPEATRLALLDNFEWWNGGGGPRGLRGDDISPVSRLVNVAGFAVFFDGIGGPDAARQALARRSGRYLDPEVVEAFMVRADELLARTNAGDVSDRLLATEPEPHRRVTDDSALDDALRVFGEAVDLKSPYFHGHSATVSRLAAEACCRLGQPTEAVVLAGRAGLVHDIGRVAVATGVWEHAGPLGSDAWQQVRLHAYHSEQILARSAGLAAVARLAGAHHERLDGGGYHRGIPGAQLSVPARVIAVADRYAALVSDRPQRPAQTPAQARAILGGEARDGRLDPDAVRAVVSAAEGTTGGRATPPAGLTRRQVDVLRLMAQGLSNRAIADRLVISPRTAEHHVQDVYARIGVTSRAAAALFAMEHGLLQPVASEMRSSADAGRIVPPRSSFRTTGSRSTGARRKAL
ncbi:HD domain-containing phosphohydrolase [Blastococcus deserti]|uniref:HD domain-containing phosphohydrolase n=1 Tax=Blastococcus deserti TaxID=2259033 RepID=A0ABW4X9I5_9ACTN